MKDILGWQQRSFPDGALHRILCNMLSGTRSIFSQNPMLIKNYAKFTQKLQNIENHFINHFTFDFNYLKEF